MGVEVNGVYLRAGDRVRICPKARADVMDLALQGRTAIIEAVEQDLEKRVHLALVLEDDPGKDFGLMRQTGHRFFYGVDEVEPVRESERTRILVACIGNIFLGDDAFGVEVARQLERGSWPSGVAIRDFGIRSYDLACALGEGYETVILVDATSRGGTPGTVYLIEPELSDLGPARETSLDGHSIDPVRALRMAAALGGRPGRVYVVGCEPGELEDPDGSMGLSDAVRGAVPTAVELVGNLVGQLLRGTDSETSQEAGMKGLRDETNVR